MLRPQFVTLRNAARELLVWSLIISLTLPVSCVQTRPNSAPAPAPAPPPAPAPRSPAEVDEPPVMNFPVDPMPGYCVAKSPTAAMVRPDLLDPKFKSDVGQWNANAKAIFAPLLSMRDALLTEGSAFSRLGSTLNGSAAATTDFKAQTLALLAEFPRAYRQQGMAVITSYFRIVSLRAELQQLLEPRRWGLDELRLQYAMELPPGVFAQYLASGDFNLPGIDVDPIQKNGQLVYRLSINGETTFNSLVRAAARSPGLQHPQEAYLETVRCAVGRAILGKYDLNEAILTGGNASQPLSPDENFCLGAKTRDFTTLAGRETDISRELLLRSDFLKGLPQFSTKLSTATTNFLKSNGMIGQMADLAAFPDLLSTLNINRMNSGLPVLDPDGAFKTAFAEIDQLINAEYGKYPAWGDLRLVWKNPAIQAQLNSIFTSCDLPMVDREGKPLTVNDYWTNLMRADDVVFLATLYSDIGSVPGRWLSMDRDQLTTTLRNYILTKKVEASMQAFSYLVDYLYVSARSADPDDTMAVVYDDLSRSLQAEFTRIWDAKPELQNWLNGMVDTIEREKTNPNAYHGMLQAFTGDLIQGADAIAKIMDPKRAASTLPYDEQHVLGALTVWINSLSPDNRRRYDLLVNTHDPVQRNQLWNGIHDLLVKEAAQKGATCGAPGLGERVRNLVGGWFSQKSVDKTLASDDCTNLTMVAQAINSDRTKRPDDLASTLAALRDNGIDDGKLNDWITDYRQRLASSITAESTFARPADKRRSGHSALAKADARPRRRQTRAGCAARP